MKAIHLLTTGILITFISLFSCLQAQISPENIQFVRQGVKRLIFDQGQAIPLAVLDPAKIIGMSAMHPITHYSSEKPTIEIQGDKLLIQSNQETESAIWFGGFNPFATYTIDLGSCRGEGEIGFEFSDPDKENQFFLTVSFKDSFLAGAYLTVKKAATVIVRSSILTKQESAISSQCKLILQLLGSGLTLYAQDQGLLIPIGQSDFNQHLDLREKQYIHSFQSHLYTKLSAGKLIIKKVEAALTTGIGLADIRTITYEDGAPLIDQGRLWYTMSIRGRALSHHIQGVFSMNPSVFDIRLEGIIAFDRQDGLLRNEIASHIYFDRSNNTWRGLTTGFSAFANPEKEKKQLLAIESQQDPRFGFSVMQAKPFGMVGDIEDPHIVFDSTVQKWRMFTCTNQNGYKAIVLESDHWNRDYVQIAGPVVHNSTGTSIQQIGKKRYCFSGSSEREVFIYSYPDLQEIGTLQMDLPPWDEHSRTRVWPNVIQLPDGYPVRYLALMMDRFNYLGLTGPNWTYGALYLYYGFEK